MRPEMRMKILDLLARHNNMTIATVRSDGYPQATTVGYVNDGLDIYFGCGAKSQKARNLARNNKVSAAIDSDHENWAEIEGLSLGGAATPVTSVNELEKVGALFVEKFPQVAAFTPEQQMGTTIFRVTPSVISVLDYSKGFGRSDLVAV